MAFAAHYFYCKALSADEGWAEERAAELRSKSYDASHIDSIAERYRAKTPEQEEKPKAPPGTP